MVEAEPRPDEAVAGAGDAPPADTPAEGLSATARLLSEPRLDSLDAPRPSSRSRRPARGSRRLENAATEPMSSDPGPTISLIRPPTAAEVAAATNPAMTPPAGSGAIRAAASNPAMPPLAPRAALDAAATLSVLNPDPLGDGGEPRAERTGEPGDKDEASPAGPQRS